MVRTRQVFCLIAFTALFLPACPGSKESAPASRLPDVIVEMYDEGTPDGMIEIEADRDGSIREVEVTIRVGAVPAAIVAAAEALLPDAEILGAELEYIAGKKAYEVQMALDGLNHELVFDESAKLVEREAELNREDAPAGFVDAALDAIPGSTFTSVEKITRGSEVAYHVKVSAGGATYKLMLSADGEIVRKVREARAEIEIPLR